MNKMRHPVPVRLNHFAIYLALVTLSCLFLLSKPTTAVGPLSVDDDFAQRLTEPHTGLIDGQSLRLAIKTVAEPQTQPNDHINVWLDRKVNPDAPVSPGGLGPTRYASLCQIANSAGCVCYPVDNCILIGRPEWVAELSRLVLRDDDSAAHRSRRGDVNSTSSVDVHWPSLTTPNEALQIVVGHSAKHQTDGLAGGILPHDLWPETTLRDISPQLAIELIQGQFIHPDASRIDLPFERTYRFSGAKAVVNSLRSIDPTLQVKSAGGEMRLLCTPKAHQVFCQQVLSIPDPDAKRVTPIPTGNALERLKSNERIFSLKVSGKPAGPLIQALAGQIGIECQFDPPTNPRLAKLVTFSAVDQTLWDLVRLITDRASLKIDAVGDKLRISARD